MYYVRTLNKSENWPMAPVISKRNWLHILQGPWRQWSQCKCWSWWAFLTCNWSILGFTCMKAFPQYQVISLDSTSQATHVETCCYVVWGKERNLYQWSTNRGRAAALVKFQNPIAVKNLEIFIVVITTWQNIYQAVNRIYSFSFSLQDMKVCCLRTSTRMR